jgi:hypothetical protein
MVKIDLKSKKTLVFDVKNIEKIKAANFTILLSNFVGYTYPGTINIPQETITVEIPVLKDIISKEIEGNCYLELQDDNERYYRVSKDTVSFFFGSVVEVKFHAEDYEIDAQYKERNEIVIDSKNIKLTPIDYRENKELKPLKREEAILTIH